MDSPGPSPFAESANTMQLRDFYNLFLATALLILSGTFYLLVLKEKRTGRRLFRLAEFQRFCIPSNKIGTGRRGAVYRALLDDQVVVIKMFHDDARTPAWLPEMQKMLNENEFAHENVIDIKGCFLNPASQGLLVEYLPYTLYERVVVNRTETVTEHKMYLWATHICMALKYLHEKQMYHGNLILQNIRFDEKDELKVADFGEYSHGGVSVTDEQALDIFSLGLLLWSLANGTCMFHTLKVWPTNSTVLQIREFKLPTEYSPKDCMFGDVIMDCMKMDRQKDAESGVYLDGLIHRFREKL